MDNKISAIEYLRQNRGATTPSTSSASSSADSKISAVEFLRNSKKNTSTKSAGTTPAPSEVNNNTPSSTVTEAPTVSRGPRKSDVKDTITQKQDSSIIKNVAKSALGIVSKTAFENIFGGPVAQALPEKLKAATFSASPEKFADKAASGISAGVGQYKRFIDRTNNLVASMDSKKTSSDRTSALLDFSTSLITDVGGATFNAAMETASASPVGKLGKAALDNSMSAISNISGKAASKALKLIPMDDEYRKKIDPSVRELAGAIAVLATFHAAGKVGVKVSKIDRFSKVLGMKDVVGESGKPRAVSAAEVQEAFKRESEKILSSGDDVPAKMDILNASESVMRSYAELGPDKFETDIQPSIDKLDEQSSKVLADAGEAINTASAEIKADNLDTILKKPADKSTVSAIKSMDKDMQFAFEQEIFDLNSKNDPKLSKDAGEKSINYERIADQFDERPAHYDVLSNTIRLNEVAIDKTLNHLMEGKILKIGEGRLVSTIRKISGESLESLKSRYEKELVRHEMAHAETITPHDVDRLNAAIRSNDKALARKIRIDLEERASKHVVENGDALSPKIDKSLDAMIAREQIIGTARSSLDALKFTSTERDSAYKKWKEIVSRNSEYRTLNFDEFENKLKNTPAYRDKSVKALFEDALDKADLSTNTGTLDDLLTSFNKRLDSEIKIRNEYKKAKAEQATLFPKQEKLDKRTSSLIKRAINAERKVAKLEGNSRRLELGNLRERIRARLSKEVMRENFDRMTEKRKDKVLRRDKRRSIKLMLKRSAPKRTLSGKLTGKMTPRQQAIIDKVEKMTKMDRNEAVASVMASVEKWRADHPNDAYIPDDLALDVNISDTAGLDKQSLEQLKNTEAFIKGIIEEGKSERKEIVDTRKAEMSRIKKSILKYTTGSEGGLTPSARSIINKKESLLSAAWWDTGTPSEFVRNLSPEVQKLFKKTVASVEEATARVKNVENTIENIGRELYGKSWQVEYHENMRKSVDLGESVFANNEKGKIETSRIEAMAVYAGLKDPKFRKNLFDVRGNAWTKEIADKVLSVLTPEDKKLIERVGEETYKSQYSRFASAVEKDTGVALGHVEGYAGDIRYESDMSKKPDSTPSDILIDGIKRRLGVSSVGIKSRTSFVGKMRLSSDPIVDAINYVRRTEHYIQISDKMRYWDSIIRDGDIARAAIRKNGESFWNGLKFHVDDIRQGGIVKEQQIAFNRWIQNRQGDVSAALIAKPTVWIGQLSSIAQFRAEAMNGKNFWKGVMNYKEMEPLIKKYAPAVEARSMKTAYEYTKRLEGGRGKVSRLKEAIKEKLSIPMEKADKLTTAFGSAGIFNDRVDYYKKRGRSLEEAYKEAGEDIADIIVRTQSTSSFLGKSNLEKRTGIGQVLTTLRNQPNKIARAPFMAIKDWREGRITKKQMISFIYWNNVVQPAMYYTLRWGMKGAMASATASIVGSLLGNSQAAQAIRDKNNEDGYLSGLAANMVNNATGFLVAGDIINLAMENGIMGKSYEFRPSVLQSVGDDFSSAAKQFSAGDIDESTVIMIRALSRSYGIGDPGDLIKTMLTIMSKNNADRKAEARKTPEARKAAAIKARESAIKKRQDAINKK